MVVHPPLRCACVCVRMCACLLEYAHGVCRLFCCLFVVFTTSEWIPVGKSGAAFMACSSGPATLLLAPAALPTPSPPSPFPRGLSHEQPGGLLCHTLLHGEGSHLLPCGAFFHDSSTTPLKTSEWAEVFPFFCFIESMCSETRVELRPGDRLRGVYKSAEVHAPVLT